MTTLVEAVTINKNKLKLLVRIFGIFIAGHFRYPQKKGKIMPTQIKRIRSLAIL